MNITSRPRLNLWGSLAIILLAALSIGLNLTQSAIPVLSQETPHWEPFGPSEPDTIFGIYVDPNNSMRLYATSRTGLYRSTDSGESWELTRSGHLTELVFNPQDSNTLYIDDHVLLRSMDGGDTWSERDSGMTIANVGTLAIAASDPNILFAGGF